MDKSNKLYLRLSIILMLNGYISTLSRDFDRTPPNTDPSIHHTNETEVRIWDKKWPTVLAIIICILVVLGMICVFVCVFCKRSSARRKREGESAQQRTRLNDVQIYTHPIFEQGDSSQGHGLQDRYNSSEELYFDVGNSDNETNDSETETEATNKPLLDIRSTDGSAEISIANENTNDEENVSLANEKIESQTENHRNKNNPVPLVLRFRDIDELNASTNGNAFNGSMEKVHINKYEQGASGSS